MTHIDLERWSSNPRKLARDADFAAADAEHARRAEEARLEAEAEAEQARLAAEHRAKLERALEESVHGLLQAAAELERSGVHLYDAARVAGRAAARSRFGVDHPLDDRTGDFLTHVGTFASMGLG